jgi:O-antigen ligase
MPLSEAPLSEVPLSEAPLSESRRQLGRKQDDGDIPAKAPSHTILNVLFCIFALSYVYSGMFWLPIRGPFATNQSSEVYISIAMTIICIAFFVLDDLESIIDVPLFLIASFLFFVISSYLWSVSNTNAFFKLIVGIVNIPLSYFIGLFMMRRQCMRTFALMVIVLAVFTKLMYFEEAAAQAASDDSVITYQAFSEIYTAGAIMCFSYLMTKPGWTKINTNLAIFLAMFFIAAMLESGGRGGALSLIVSYISIYFVSNGKFKEILLCVIVVFVGYIYFNIEDIGLALSQIGNEYQFRTLERTGFYILSDSYGDTSDPNRSQLMHLAFKTWQNAPLFGVGLGGFPVAAELGENNGMYPHNIILEILAEQGVVGLSIFLPMVGIIGSGAIRKFASVPRFELFSTVGFATAAIITSNVSGQFVLDRPIWVSLGFLAGIATSVKFSQSAEAAASS